MESRSEDKPESKKLLGKINDDNTLLDKIKYHKTNILIAIFVVLIIIGFALTIGGGVSKVYALLGVGMFMFLVEVQVWVLCLRWMQ